MSMFLQPWMLLGLLGVAVPIVIHLINRRRAQKIEFAAIAFLFDLDKKLARNLKIKERLVLLTRCLMVAAIALAAAKPMGCDSELEAGTASAASLVFIVDTSAAMHYEIDGESSFKKAVEQTQKLLDSLHPDSEAALLACQDTHTQSAELSRDRFQLVKQLEKLDVSVQGCELAIQIESADALLANSELTRKQIVIVTSGMETVLGDAPKPRLASLPTLRIHDVLKGLVESDASLPNLSVADVKLEHTRRRGPFDYDLRVLIKNHSKKDFNNVMVQLSVGTKKLASSTVSVPALSSQVKVFSHLFKESGLHLGAISIDHDAFKIDDQRVFVVSVAENINVLLVNGDPRTIKTDDELFFLSRALKPGSRSKSLLAPKIIYNEDISKVNFEDYAVVALANVPYLNEADAVRLKQFVRKGGGLFLTMGDKINGRRWNETLGDLLPRKLRDSLEVTDPLASDARAKMLSMRLEQDQHPMLSIFEGALRQTISSAQFHKYYLTEPDPTRPGETLLSFSNGSPAMVSHQVGQGSVVLFLSTIDHDWSNLPTRGSYLPLMQQVFTYLAGAALFNESRALYAGQPFKLPSYAGTQTLVSPSGLETELDKNQSEFGQTVDLGIYKVTVKNSNEMLAAQAINLDPVLSSLKKVNLAKWRNGTSSLTEAQTEPVSNGFPLWPYTLLGLFLLLVTETGLLLIGAGRSIETSTKS